MIPELGHFALALATAIAAAQGVLLLWGASVRDRRMMAAAPAFALSQLLAAGFSFAALVWSHVVSDFSVLDVAQNSSSLTPLLYRITGTWGDHNGSILLWCLMLSGCGGAVALFGRELPAALRARVLGVLGLVSAGFLLFTLAASNPFLRLWPPPGQGQDVNPLLQDPGLAIHPPMLYAGYVGFSVAFAFAVAALIEGRVDAAWGRWVRPWTLGAWCLLTGGIALGSWWSYYELGWGGYWFWDPVENASLLPWLTGTALLHCAIVVEKREALKTWAVLLAIATFSLSLCGTFLVRSGLLDSVHSFAADPTQGIFILVLLALTVGGSLLLFALRAPALAPSGLFAPLSREGALVLNNILLCSIATVVFLGTLYPPFADLLAGQKISVGPPFFERTVLPLAVPLLAAMAVGPVLSWKRAELAPALLRLWWGALLAAIGGGAVALGWKLVPGLGIALALWIIAGAFAEIVDRIRLFRRPLGESLARLAGLRRSVFGTAIAHAGLGVTIAGISGMALAAHTLVFLRPGQSAHLAGYDWKYVSIAGATGANFTARVSTLVVSRNGHQVVVMHPGKRSFPISQMTTSEVAIWTNGFLDLYAVLGNERDGGAVFRLNYHPLAPEIWLGALVMALGGGLSLSDRRLRVGAPARRAAAAPAPVRAG